MRYVADFMVTDRQIHTHAHVTLWRMRRGLIIAMCILVYTGMYLIECAHARIELSVWHRLCNQTLTVIISQNDRGNNVAGYH